jgi:hypothetical protein
MTPSDPKAQITPSMDMVQTGCLQRIADSLEMLVTRLDRIVKYIDEPKPEENKT